jgi:methyl-accepting chemotaxis protein
MVTQSNSATAEESAATSEELLSQMQMLKELIMQFQLADTSDQL